MAATRLYLRRSSRNVRGLTNARLSTAIASVDAVPSGGAVLRDLIRGHGRAVTTLTIATLAQIALQRLRYGIWVSPTLKAGTIGAQTITVALGANENNGSANLFHACAIGVVKQDGTVRGYIFDADANQGNEYGTASEGRVFTVAGSAVSGIIDSDRIFFEWFARASQGGPTSRTATARIGGLTDPTEGTPQTDAASYIEFPNQIDFHAVKSAA